MSEIYFKKLLLIIIIVMICGAFVARLSVANDAESIKRLVPTASPKNVDMKQTFNGELVCLPHKDTNGPQTLECAMGLLLEDGRYVATDFGPEPVSYNTGQRLQLSGTFVPIEAISTDMWQKYPVEGILRVENAYKLKVK